MHDEEREPTLDDWIIVPKWHRFQHYKDRHPTWIKIYARLLHDPAYLDLSLAARGLLQGIWLAYACESGVVTVRQVCRILHTRDTKPALVSLQRAGFIHFSASKPLALKTEKETEKEKRVAKARTNKEYDLRQAAWHVADDWKGNTEGFGDKLDSLERELGARLTISFREQLFEHAFNRKP